MSGYQALRVYEVLIPRFLGHYTKTCFTIVIPGRWSVQILISGIPGIILMDCRLKPVGAKS